MLPPAHLRQAPINAVRICNTDSGCAGLVTDTVAISTPLVLYAAGYRGGSFRGNEPATWSVSSGAGLLPIAGISTTLTGTLLGTVVVTATLIATPTIVGTAMLTVTPGALTRLLIRDAPGGGGNVVTDATRVAGTAWTLYAAGYDSANNLIDRPVVTWSVQGGIGSLAPQVGSSTVFTAGAAGTGRITARASDTITAATGSITVIVGAPDHFRVSLPPTGSAGIGFGAVISAEDAANNTVVTFTNSITLSSSNGGIITPQLVTPTAGVWSGLITLTTAGAGRVVRAEQGSLSGQGTITLTAGLPATMTIAPRSAIRAAGSPITYTAVATDAFGNSIGDVTASTAFTITPASGGGFTGNVVTPTIAGSWSVAGARGGLSDTARITVTSGAPYTLTLAPATVVVSAGTAIAYTAVATDAFGNAAGDVTASTVFTITPASGGVFVGNIVTPTIAGVWLVTGINSSASNTATVRVNPGPPGALALSPPAALITASARLTFTAVATDGFGNLLGDVTASTVFTITPASGGVFAGNAVTPTIARTWTITGVYGGVSDTAVVTVTPAAFFRLSIEDAPGDTAAPVMTVTLSLYDTLTAYAIGYDAYNNRIGPRLATWTGSGVLSGTLSPAIGVSTTLTPAPIVSGTGFMTAVSDGRADAGGPITVQAPLLRISKSDRPDPVTPGSLLEYTIVYTNAGSAAAQNVLITETYPAGASFLIANPAPVTGTNVWSIASLPAGASGAIDVFVNVASELPVSSTLTNTVRMGAAGVAAAIFTETTRVDSAPDVTISKLDSADPVRIGDTLVYVIQYANAGSAPVTGVRITETYPAQVTFVSANPPPSFGDNVWVTGTLSSSSGTQFIYVTTRVNSPLPDLITLANQVVIDTNETGPFTSTQVTLARAPIVSLAKSAQPIAPAANSLLTYTLRYTNSGSTYASNVVVTDAIPGNANYLSCAPAGLCSPLGNLVTWNLGQVPSQTSGLLTATALVRNNLYSGTLLVNTARISATENVSAFVRITNTVTSAPDVQLSKSDGVSGAAAGEVLTYTLRYTNSGNSPAANVVITDLIPAHTIWLTCAPTCAATGGGVYSFSRGTLNAGSSGSVTLTVQVSPTLPAGVQAITNTARIQTSTPGDKPDNNLAQDVDKITTQPELELEVEFDARTPYPTQIVTYSLAYTNVSAMDTTGVVMSVTHSPFVAPIPGGWSLAGGQTYTRAVGDLPAGAWGTATFAVSLPFPFTRTMDAFANTFSIHDAGPGGLPIAVDVNTATLGVPDLVIESVALSPPAVVAGQRFTATVTLRNEGQGRACNPKAPTCGMFAVDVFIDPDAPPPSFPFGGYGDDDAFVDPIEPGMTGTAVFTELVFGTDDSRILYFKVDNWDCRAGTPPPCIPDYAEHGLVPESDEENNVLGPLAVPDALIYSTYLPILLKQAH